MIWAAAALAHLAVCAAGLIGIKLGWFPLSQGQALHFINLNMVVAGAAALGGVAVACRAGGAWQTPRWFGRSLSGAVGLLLLSELLAWAGEFVTHSEVWYSPYTLAPLASRLALVGVCLVGLFRGPPGRAVALAGAALYLCGDLLYHLHHLHGDTGFLMLEITFYVGYWLMALGGRKRGGAHEQVNLSHARQPDGAMPNPELDLWDERARSSGPPRPPEP